MSVDELVLDEVKNMPLELEKPELVRLAQRVVSEIQSYQQEAQETSSDNRINTTKNSTHPKDLKSVRVRDFRNIENLEFEFGPELVKSLILHGPNGTGKYALFEAICFGLSQISNRYCEYLKDKDVAGRDLARQYVETFLRPIRSAKDNDKEPMVWINGEKTPIEPIPSEDDANHINIQISGTVLSQELSREFINMSSHQLGAMVLLGYSDLAERLELYVNNNYKSADRSRQEFLEDLSLTKSITLISTAKDRIVDKLIQSDLPNISQPLLDWLELAGNIDLPDYREAKRLSSAWNAWSDNAKKARLVKEISSLSKVKDIQEILVVWLEQYNQLVEETTHWTDRLSRDDLKPLQRDAEFLENKLSLWGEWLSKQTARSDVPSAEEVENLRKEMGKLNREQQETIMEGKENRARLDHFALVERFVCEDWIKSHPNECPTCGANLEEEGGILKIFKNLQSRVEEEREKQTGKYKKTTSKIKEIEMKLVKLGQQECPVSAEDQAKLMQSLQWLVPNGKLLSDYISERESRIRLIQQIQTLRHFPSIPTKIDPDVESERVAEKAVEGFQKAATVFKEPDNWKVIKNKLYERLSSIVERHLPDTLGNLWIELAMNLTPAPWLLPKMPKFQVKSLRSERHLSVRLGDEKDAPLARYILNQAEVHIMGLAWFFTKYLTHGRFNHSCIIMDDPAQEMDQITYRDLCRFLETIVRLHKFQSKPLTMLIMLNQQSRALDAARVTEGLLTVLGLHDYQRNDTVERRDLLGQDFYSCVPALELLYTNE